MSFDASFDFRWKEVLSPAIRSIAIDGVPLEPIRVDARIVGDSILTEILSGIGTCQVVLADITSIGNLNDRPIRNGNVMYEVGLAHAVRLPEEVLLFRSDSESLLFDTANVRVNHYEPDQHPESSKSLVADAIISACQEVDLRRHLAVSAVANTIDAASFGILVQCQQKGAFTHPERKTMGQAMSAISVEAAIQRLLTLGLIEVRFKGHTKEELASWQGEASHDFMPYFRTPFGDAVFREIALRMTAKSLSESTVVGVQ